MKAHDLFSDGETSSVVFLIGSELGVVGVVDARRESIEAVIAGETKVA